MGCLTASAQSYRGFIDLFGGIGTGAKTEVEKPGVKIFDIYTPAAFGLSTTHGFQITPWLYTGLGVGVYGALDNGRMGDYPDDIETEMSSFYVPVYLDLRWDLNIRKKVTPYVSLKLGYQIAANVDDESTFITFDNSYSKMLALKMEGVSGFYFRPTVGLRFRMGKKSGFNLGVSYNPTIRKNIKGFYGDYSYDDALWGEYGDGEYYDVKKVTYGSFMLNLGFDF